MIHYTTLWEVMMKQFPAELFTDMATKVAGAIALNDATADEALAKIIDYDLPQIKELAEKLKGYEQCFTSLDLQMSALTLNRLIDVLTNGKSKYSDVDELMNQLQGRLADELKLHKFFCLEKEREVFLFQESLFGTKVASNFPSTAFDIEEAGKCIAFERWTASVFHLGRIAEIALVVIGKRVGYNDPKPGFGSVLKFMDGQLTKLTNDYKNASPYFRGNQQFLSAITAHMHSVNNAWRTNVAHLDRKYTEEEAIRIWYATKGLMEEVANNWTEEQF